MGIPNRTPYSTKTHRYQCILLHNLLTNFLEGIPILGNPQKTKIPTYRWRHPSPITNQTNKKNNPTKPQLNYISNHTKIKQKKRENKHMTNKHQTNTDNITSHQHPLQR